MTDWKLGLAKWAGLTSGVVSLVLPVVVSFLLIGLFAALSSGVCGFRAFVLARRGVFSTFCVFFPVGVVTLRLLFSLL